MAFEKIEKSFRGTINQEPQIRLGYYLGNDKNKNKTLYVALTKALLEMLGWPLQQATEPSTRISTTIGIQEGTKDDAGFLLVTYDPKGFAIGTTTGKGALNQQHWTMTANVAIVKFQNYAVNEPTEEKAVYPAEYTIIEGNQLLVQCPDWLRYNGPPADPKPAPEQKEAAQVRQPRPTPTRKLAREVVDDVAVDLASDNTLHLNRAQRRRLAADVARKISH